MVIMKTLLLTKIRLSWYFMFFFASYFVALGLLPRFSFESAALALFSVNSFLYGFYISPVLAAQKARIEELHRIVRAEANAIFAMVLATKKMPKSLRTDLQDIFTKYLKQTAAENSNAAENTYEELIGRCVDYKGDAGDKVDALLEKLVANQQNRTNMKMQMSNMVFSNEWMIMFVLFSITLTFILLIDTGSLLAIRIVTALLATALTMLMISLIKLNTLTHKKARSVWAPLQTLIKTRYYRID